TRKRSLFHRQRTSAILSRMKPILATAIIAISVPISHAHPGPDGHGAGLRPWTSAATRSTVWAAFVVVRDEQVQLRGEDGSLAWVPLAFLSDADRAWVRQRTTAIRAANGGGPGGGDAPAPAIAAHFRPFKD